MKTKLIETLKGTISALLYLIGIVTVITFFKDLVPLWVYYIFFFGTVFGFCIYMGMPKYTYWSYTILMEGGETKEFLVMSKGHLFPRMSVVKYQQEIHNSNFVIISAFKIEKDYFEYLQNKNKEEKDGKFKKEDKQAQTLHSDSE